MLFWSLLLWLFFLTVFRLLIGLITFLDTALSLFVYLLSTVMTVSVEFQTVISGNGVVGALWWSVVGRRDFVQRQYLGCLRINCCYWNRLCMNALISSADASAFPAVESSYCICIGNFPNRKVSTNPEGLSPKACLAVFFSVFRNSANVSLLGS